MAHFNPYTWTIDLSEFSSTNFDSDAIAQSVFVHEYIHYVQILISTLGRLVLTDIVRMAVWAGHYIKYKGNIPKKLSEQVNLLQEFNKVGPDYFDGTDVKADYRKLIIELNSTLYGEYGIATPPDNPSFPFFKADYDFGHGIKYDGISHLTAFHAEKWFHIPLTDRIFLDNMARMVQENYLYFNIQSKGHTEKEIKKEGEVLYRGIYNYLNQILPRDEYQVKWAVGLIQFSLFFRHPHLVFPRICERLIAMLPISFENFIKRIGQDPKLKKEFDIPPLQEIMNELIDKWGSAMSRTDCWDLRELCKLIANAYNTLKSNFLYFSDPLIEFKHVKAWTQSFGCPIIVFQDGPKENIAGIKMFHPWSDQLEALHRLLA